MPTYRPNRVYEKIVKIAYDLIEQGKETEGQELLEAIHEVKSKTILGSLPPDNLMRALDLLLTDLGIQYAVIGGIAISVHGKPRATQDIDVLVSKLPDANQIKNKDYMRTFGFYPSKSYSGTILILDHDKGMIELLVANNDVRKWALDTANVASVLGSDVPVISPEALIATKVQAIRNNPDRLADDSADIVSVFMRNNVNLDEVMAHLSNEEKKILTNILPKK